MSVHAFPTPDVPSSKDRASTSEQAGRADGSIPVHGS